MVQNVLGRQSQGYPGNAGNNQVSGARVINAVENTRANQPRVIRYYNCKGEGHMAKQCTTRKRVKDSKWFKEKMLLAQAQEVGVVLDEEQHDLLADNCDDEATTNAIFMANLSPVCSINDDTVAPRYDSDTLSEVPHYDTYHDSDVVNSNIQELRYIENIVSTNESMMSSRGFIAEVKEMKDIFEQMKDEVDQCSMAKKCFEIEKKQLLINNDRLLEANIASDIMCTYLRSLNEVDNCVKCKSLEIVLLDLQESNKSLSELRKRFAKLEEYNITLDIAFQNHKEQMILNNPDTKNKQLLVKTINNQYVQINDLKVQVQDKIQKIEDENVSLAFQTEPINAYFKNNRAVHRNYLRVTKEHVAKLKELLEQARALKPLDEHIGYASKFATKIQELLRRVSSTNASRSKPRSNTKNDRILQPSNYNANVKNVALSKNSDTICLSCNECLFSANHDACVVQYLKKIQKCEWKPTGRIFKTISLKWVPTGRMFTLVESKCSSSPSRNTTTKILPNRQIPNNTAVLVDVSCLKLSLRYANTQESLLKCMINLDFHPFNLHEFGFEGIIRDEELPPWKFDYLGVT
ncbi:reverse transcriptase domain-containing protein [Tanacetum coccineum]